MISARLRSHRGGGLALEERKQGGIGSMSAMVREALDQLIASKKAAKK